MSDVSKKSLEIETSGRTAKTDTVTFVRDPALPAPQGLYNPAHEKDSCGVGFIADMKNRKTRAIVEPALQIPLHRYHRGAVGADRKSGEGCWILVHIPN